MDKYVLKLYISGQTPRSLQAVQKLQRFCEQELPGQFELVVIDVLDHPQVAETENILATPTVVKELPKPSCRVIGDQFDAARLLLGFRPRMGDNP
jgi:circadian clock protein KaiB